MATLLITMCAPKILDLKVLFNFVPSSTNSTDVYSRSIIIVVHHHDRQQQTARTDALSSPSADFFYSHTTLITTTNHYIQPASLFLLFNSTITIMSDDAAETKPEGGSEPITVRVRDQVSHLVISTIAFIVDWVDCLHHAIIAASSFAT